MITLSHKLCDFAGWNSLWVHCYEANFSNTHIFWWLISIKITPLPPKKCWPTVQLHGWMLELDQDTHIINNPPLPWPVLFVVQHTCTHCMWCISWTFVTTLSPSVQASLACFHWICPFAIANHFLVHKMRDLGSLCLSQAVFIWLLYADISGIQSE